jgi:hypothetical protein
MFEEEAEDGVSWNKKGLRRKINYSFRIVISLIHYFLAYLEFTASETDSDDPSSGETTHISIAADSSTDDAINYHNPRRQDAFFYYHAALLALSLMMEVTASFLCKKKLRRSTARASFTAATASRSGTESRPPRAFVPKEVVEDSATFENENPLRVGSDDKAEDDQL